MSFCCVCNGVCCHTGPHSYCEHHSQKNNVPTPIINMFPGTFHSIDPRVTELLEEVKLLREEIKELKETRIEKPPKYVIVKPHPDIPSKYPPYGLRIQKNKVK